MRQFLCAQVASGAMDKRDYTVYNTYHLSHQFLPSPSLQPFGPYWYCFPPHLVVRTPPHNQNITYVQGQPKTLTSFTNLTPTST